MRVIASSITLTLGLYAQGAVNLKSPEFIARGTDLFAKNCAVGYCHGAEGRAARGPQLRDRTWNPQHLFKVTHDGLPGTSMPAWKDLLAVEDIWAVVAYILSISSGEIENSAAVVELAPTRASPGVVLSGEAKTGHDLFFDLTNQKRCGICHRLGTKGTAIGPNLASIADREPHDELLRDILEPNGSIAEGFEQTVVVTEKGERVAGVKKEETEELIRVYDAASIPPPLRTFYKDQVRSVSTEKRSSMPLDYGKTYTKEELNAIVAYLKSDQF